MAIEPVYERGMILWHTLCRGYHLAPVLEYKIDGDDFVTVSEVGELRLSVSHHHDAGHGDCLSYGGPKWPN